MREGGGSHFKNISDLEKINFLFFPPSGSLFHWGCISFYYHFPFFKKKIMPCEIGSLTHLSSYVSVSQESGPCRLPPARGPCPAGPSGTPGFPPAPCRCPAGRQWCRALPREPWLVRPPCPGLRRAQRAYPAPASGLRAHRRPQPQGQREDPLPWARCPLRGAAGGVCFLGLAAFLYHACLNLFNFGESRGFGLFNKF